MLGRYASFQIQADYEVLSYTDIGQQRAAIDLALENGYNGLIICPLNSPEIVAAIDRAADRQIPVVTVNTDIKGSRRFCFIGQDGYKAGKVAGRFMGEFLSGKGEIAVLTSSSDDQQSFPFGTREGGFRQILAEAYSGIRILRTVSTYEDDQTTFDETAGLLKENPRLDGIFITCGGVKSAGKAIEESGIKGLKFICFEDYPEIIEFMNRDIVTMTLGSGLVNQGGQAAEVLLEKLIYDTNPHRKHLYSDIRVMVKESL